MREPLAGVTVVALEQAVAAPFATRQLAELGARVIKIERPGTGDFARGYDESVHGLSSYFVWLNRSKESLTLDVKHPDGRAILDRLLASADVFVQNLTPDAIGRLGLTAEALRPRHPTLITCTISGYGDSGPWAARKAYDLLVQCETGLVSITGAPDGAAKAGISVADIAAGMYAYSGILTALYQRAVSGVTQSIDVSLFEALAEWMGAPLYYTEYGGTPLARTGVRHATIAPYGPYVVGDGATVLVAIQNDREWAAFCARVLDRPELAGDERFARNSARVAHRAELDAIIVARFAALDTPGLLDRLDGARIANARINAVGDLVDHPVLVGRQRWRTVETPGGPVRALLPPATLHHGEPRMGPVPALGAHTEAILRELGHSGTDIDRLRSGAVV